MWHRATCGRVLRFGAVAAALAVVALLSVTRGPFSSEEAPAGDAPGIVSYEQDGLLLTYHVLSSTEALYDLRRDPHCLKNLAVERNLEVKTLRRLLCRKLGVHDLKELSDPGDPTLKKLKSLGYL